MQYLRIEPVLGIAHLPSYTLALPLMIYHLLRQGRCRNGTSRRNSAIADNVSPIFYSGD